MGLPYILRRVEAAGHVVFTRGALNLNLVLVRSPNRTPGLFDDLAHIVYREQTARGLQWRERIHRITTDPGLYYLHHLLNPKGCAILAPGQYRGAWRIGMHRGSHRALVQVAPVAVYRDRDFNNTLDPSGRLDWGLHGINLHRAAADWTSTEVQHYSGGCAVWADDDDHQELVRLCQASVDLGYGDAFSVTLLDAD